MLEFYPSPEEFAVLAKEHDRVPVVADLLGDTLTPVAAYERLSRSGPAFLFESVDGGEHLNRYSFLGTNPAKVIACFEDETVITTRGGESRRIPTPADPLELIEDEIGTARPARIHGLPPFLGGAVGFLGYEYIHRIEPTVPLAPTDPVKTPLAYFMMVDAVVVFDRAHQTLRLCAYGRTDGDPRRGYDEACGEIEALAALLSAPATFTPRPLRRKVDPEVPPGNMSREAYEDAVRRAKELIHAGDIVQVVLSQRFEKAYDRRPIDLYRILRTINPSPYMFLLETGDFALCGASPEVHVRLTGDLVEIRPIAGTRPRGRTEEEDTRLEDELLADPKERAEHLMLVDLARNDIGRVCGTGTVRVPDYCVVERYSHVMHIVSQITGTLLPECNAFDLLRVTFPAGTVSGAPKVRAMQIIRELEGEARGPYSGALGYFSYDGNFDSCIAIRTALLREGRIFVQSGAGIVADSVPEREYEETVNKAKGLLKSVAISETVPEENEPPI